MCHTGGCPYELGLYGESCSARKDEQGCMPKDAYCYDESEEENE